MRSNEKVVLSKSHAGDINCLAGSLFIITLQMTNNEDGSCKTGKLYLVDLAGSEVDV